MTDTDTLRKRAEAATPGPWFHHDFSELVGSEPSTTDVTVSCDHPATISVALMAGGLQGSVGEAALAQARSDAAFIAAAREAVPALLDEIDALRAKVKAQAEALKPFATLSPVSWALEADMYYIDTDDIRRAAQEAGNE